MPLFRPKSTPDAHGYYPAGAAADLGQEQMRKVDAGGVAVIVTRLEDGLYAFAAACPHAAADLARATIYRGRIDCPDHGYRFDVRSGRVLWPPDEVCRLRLFEAIEVDGQIRVRRLASPGR